MKKLLFILLPLSVMLSACKDVDHEETSAVSPDKVEAELTVKRLDTS